jgi:hypothetical protein
MDIRARDADCDLSVAANLSSLRCQINVSIANLSSAEPIGCNRAIAAAAHGIFGNTVGRGKGPHANVARAA